MCIHISEEPAPCIITVDEQAACGSSSSATSVCTQQTTQCHIPEQYVFIVSVVKNVTSCLELGFLSLHSYSTSIP